MIKFTKLRMEISVLLLKMSNKLNKIKSGKIRKELKLITKLKLLGYYLAIIR